MHYAPYEAVRNRKRPPIGAAVPNEKRSTFNFPTFNAPKVQRITRLSVKQARGGRRAAVTFAVLAALSVA